MANVTKADRPVVNPPRCTKHVERSFSFVDSVIIKLITIPIIKILE